MYSVSILFKGSNLSLSQYFRTFKDADAFYKKIKDFHNPLLSEIWLNSYPDFHISSLRKNADFIAKYFLEHNLVLPDVFSGMYNIVSELRGCANFFETWKTVVEMNCHKIQKEKELADESFTKVNAKFIKLKKRNRRLRSRRK